MESNNNIKRIFIKDFINESNNESFEANKLTNIQLQDNELTNNRKIVINELTNGTRQLVKKEKEKKMRFPSYLAHDGAAAAAEKERRPAPLERRAQHPRAQVPHTERERGTETRDNCPCAPGFLFQDVRAVKERKNNDLCFFSSRAKSFPPFFPWLRFAPLFLFFCFACSLTLRARVALSLVGSARLSSLGREGLEGGNRSTHRACARTRRLIFGLVSLEQQLRCSLARPAPLWRGFSRAFGR